jgi:DNA-binding NarL/FixJ family response regulator
MVGRATRRGEDSVVRHPGLGAQRRRLIGLINDIEAAVHARKKPERIADLLTLLRSAVEEHSRQHNAHLWNIRSRILNSIEAVTDAEVAALETRFANLTSREWQVLELVLKGNSNKQIAEVLGIGQRTVETHRASVMKKLGARSISELIRLTIVGPAEGA